MALWHILVRNVRGFWVPSGDPWDDGHTDLPGDASFDARPIEKQAGERKFNYVGTPNWQGM